MAHPPRHGLFLVEKLRIVPHWQVICAFLPVPIVANHLRICGPKPKNWYTFSIWPWSTESKAFETSTDLSQVAQSVERPGSRVFHITMIYGIESFWDIYRPVPSSTVGTVQGWAPARAGAFFPTWKTKGQSFLSFISQKCIELFAIGKKEKHKNVLTDENQVILIQSKV